MVGVIPGSPESGRRAFKAGAAAFTAGERVDVCPFPRDTALERAQWLRGFSTAEVAAEDAAAAEG